MKNFQSKMECIDIDSSLIMVGFWSQLGVEILFASRKPHQPIQNSLHAKFARNSANRFQKSNQTLLAHTIKTYEMEPSGANMEPKWRQDGAKTAMETENWQPMKKEGVGS